MSLMHIANQTIVHLWPCLTFQAASLCGNWIHGDTVSSDSNELVSLKESDWFPSNCNFWLHSRGSVDSCSLSLSWQFEALVGLFLEEVSLPPPPPPPSPSASLLFLPLYYFRSGNGKCLYVMYALHYSLQNWLKWHVILRILQLIMPCVDISLKNDHDRGSWMEGETILCSLFFNCFVNSP